MNHKSIKFDYFWIDDNGDAHCECASCKAEFSYKGLPVLVADDDFIEHLAEMGFDESIEEVELHEEWDTWVKENVEA